MADKVEFSLYDPDNVLGKLKAFPVAIGKKGARFAMRKAANLVANAAKENARKLDDPQTASAIAENIAVRFSSRTFKRTGNVLFRVGVRGGAVLADQEKSRGLPGKGTQHWRLLEFGTSRTRARPLMRSALENNINKATDEFIRQLDRWIGRNLKNIDKIK